MTTTPLIPILVALSVAAAACGDDDTTGETAAPTVTEPAATEPAVGTLGLTLNSTGIGDVLADGAGNTVYLFSPDSKGAPTCVGDCLASWPIVPELTGVGGGLDASLLGSVEHPEGGTQATYNDWPLYYFAGDASPGDTNGQLVGDVWFVVGAAGEGISGA